MNTGSEISIEDALARLKRAAVDRDPAMLIAACRSLEKATGDLIRSGSKSQEGLLSKCKEVVTQAAAALLSEEQGRKGRPAVAGVARSTYVRVDRNGGL